MTSRRTKISPKTGRGLGHVTHTIFGSTVGYPSDSLASCFIIEQPEHRHQLCAKLFRFRHQRKLPFVLSTR